jgi:hypothetical protein
VPLNEKDSEGKPKFAARTALDVLLDFTENKLSPVASVLRDAAKGEDQKGNAPTVLGETSNLLTPLPVTTGVELYQDKHSAGLAALIADMLGIAVSDYAPKPPKAKKTAAPAYPAR